MMERMIDSICQETKNPTLLNALHACRPGHPLGKGQTAPFYNAYFLAMQQDYFHSLPHWAEDWLLKQSKNNNEKLPMKENGDE